MENFKGTPGKWSVNDDHTVIDENGFSVAEADSVYRILDKYEEKTGHGHWSGHPGETYLDVDDEEATANARLIESAPELLSISELFMKYLNGDLENETDSYLKSVVQDGINKALGTPEKSTGQKMAAAFHGSTEHLKLEEE